MPTADGNIEITPTTTDWTNQNVTVTVEAGEEVSGYTIQTKLNH